MAENRTIVPAPAIHCEGLGKRYFLRDNDANPVKRVIRKMRPGARELREHWALRGVDLTIMPGESVALIGMNGSGKSTLLKMITGITRVTDGSLTVNGRVGGILDLAAGFHPDLTGYENIFLQATLLGLPRREIWNRLKSIEEFCELGKFLNSPVRHYSSGMFLRLAFAIAVHTDPDIFIIDEALAVGDGYFMWKCVEKLQEMQSQGKTLLYVSHIPEQVESLCKRAIWLHRGAVRQDGPITDVVQNYHEFQFANLLTGEPQAKQHDLSALIPYSRFGSGAATMRDVKLCDASGKPARFFSPGETMTVNLTVTAKKAMPRVSLYFIVERPNQSVTFIDSLERNHVYELEPGENQLVINLPNLPLQPGPYLASVAIGDADNIDDLYDAHQKVYSFTVTHGELKAEKFSHGMLTMDARLVRTEGWTYEGAGKRG